ncbi:MAG: RlmE family RNA methyltransferase [Deltaproteobacteria bacterium]|nr:RlmE family RNA methyltransferase [Deltaproteobacteria bacterium]
MAIKDRQRLNDHYSQKARSQGYPARSVYKLAELDQGGRLFKPGDKVLDLGAAPGSWALYAAQKVGLSGLVLGVDLNPLAAVYPPPIRFMAANVLESPETLAKLKAEYPDGFNAALSDMAPKTTGRKDVDQARSLDLVKGAWEWAQELVRPGGLFLFKVFQSEEANQFIETLTPSFNRVKRLKPKATRTRSQEIFILFEGLKAIG